MRATLFENLVESRLSAGPGGRFRAVPMSLAIHAMLLTGVALAPLLLSPGALPEPARAVRDIIFSVPSMLPPPAAPAARNPVAPATRSRGPGRPLPVFTASESAPVTQGAAVPDGAPWAESVRSGAWFPDAGSTAPDHEVGSGGSALPVRVGAQVKEPRKLRHVTPRYPEIARAARVQGVVVLECLIDEQGRVKEVKLLRGLPLLDQAAIEAVKQWLYTPTLLNGVPVPVVMTVTVNFRLSSAA